MPSHWKGAIYPNLLVSPYEKSSTEYTYFLAYLKYLNKYALTTNVSTYVKYVKHIRTLYYDNCALHTPLCLPEMDMRSSCGKRFVCWHSHILMTAVDAWI